MSLILVVGIPHGGTTILRKIIGNIEGVLDYHEEIDAIMGVNVEFFLSKIKDTSYNAIVVKSAFTPINLKQLVDPRIKIIYIIKNPYDIYGSYRVRFNDEDYYLKHYIERYGIGKYGALARLWLDLRNRYIGIYTIKYEELFDNDYAKLKDMISWLGYQWVDEIVCSKRVAGHQYIKGGDVKVVNTAADNAPYRYHQINKEFKDMTGESSVHIYENTKKILDSMEVLKELDYAKYSP